MFNAYFRKIHEYVHFDLQRPNRKSLYLLFDYNLKYENAAIASESTGICPQAYKCERTE